MADAQLCGSVNLDDAATVLETLARFSGHTLHRVPDGETGPRQQWIMAQMPRFAANNDFVRLEDSGFAYLAKPNFRPRDGLAPQDVGIDLGYADGATESYPLFRKLRVDGRFASDSRFQISLPTPAAIAGVFIHPEHQATITPVIRDAMKREIESIALSAPLDDLAVQWDVAVEFSWLEGSFEGMPSGPVDEPTILAQLSALGDLVPEPAELGYHLCYGDAPEKPGDVGKHFVQPKDTSLLVHVANAIVAAAPRPVHWIHMPVPIERDDDAYFAPLEGLRLPETTRLFLGLVHWQDGVPGAQRRIAAAAKYVRGFGVATECGMGRRPRAVIPNLLQIQRDVVVPA